MSSLAGAFSVDFTLAKLSDGYIKSGKITVFFEGYFSNRTDLAAKAGLDKNTDAPTVLIHLYRRFGRTIFSELAGEFALALFDAEARAVHLAHDELGIVPIFYRYGAIGLQFASRLDEFRSLFGCKEIDEDYLLHRLAPGDYFGSRTPYAGVTRLSPGESLSFDLNGARFHDVWTLDEIEPIHGICRNEAKERLVDLVEQSIRVAVEPTSRTWAQLSGGLDSSTVFSMAQRALATHVPAMSIVSKKWGSSDESAWMRIVLEKHPADWHTINEDTCMPFSGQSDRALGEPNVLDLRPGWARAHAALMNDKVDILLTGEGGDSLFLGDGMQGRHLADSFSFLRFPQSLADIRSWSSAEHRSTRFGFTNYVATPQIRAYRKIPLDFIDLRPEWLARRYRESRRFKRMNWGQNLPRCSTLSDRWTLERLVSLARAATVMQRQLPTRASIRHPLLNTALLRFMLQLPPSIKFDPNIDRVLQRDAFRNIVPDRILDRVSKGLTDQLWIEGLAANRDWQERLTERPRLVELGIVEALPWRSFIELMAVAPPQSYMRFNDFASIEIWLQNLGEFADPPLDLFDVGS